MANKSPEQEFLYDLRLSCKGFKQVKTIYNHYCKSKDYMDFEADFELQMGKHLLRCEAKVASQLDGSDYRDKHNAVHKVFGEILKGRKLIGARNQSKNVPCYILLIPGKDYIFFKSNIGKYRMTGIHMVIPSIANFYWF